ncbi:MAG TPA: NAD-dependent epimerase/dehydratase family protein [Polyangia bacterium]|nr:NAD-dependent epimerase/dehydratase family protein [Polyangia bacterium]
MRIFVTGAAGFIGSHLSERLCARGDEVVGFDNFDPFYPRATKEQNLARLRGEARFSFAEGDIRDAAALGRAFGDGRFDVVVHLAALAGVRPSLAEPARYADVNLVGTQRMIDAARAAGARRFVFASSSSVYGLDSEPPFKESDLCLKPLSPYASTKRSGELLLWAAHHLYALDVACLRFFTVYGPRQRPDLAIHKFGRLISAGKPIQLFGDGSTSRDYTYIDDIIDGVAATIDEAVAAPGHRIYNLGGSRTTTLLGLVELISRALGKKPTIEWLPEQPGDMKRTLADVTLSGRALGYAPKVPIEEGITRFVAWLKTQA